MAHAVSTKLLVRGLPPGLSEDAFRGALSSFVQDDLEWLRYYPGKSGPHGTRSSVAFLKLRKPQLAPLLKLVLERHTWKDQDEVAFQCHLVPAPFAKLQTKASTDAEAGTYEQDEVYKSFMSRVEDQEQKRKAAPVITATSTVQPLEKSSAPVVTPLMQHIISKHEQAAKATRGSAVGRNAVRGRNDPGSSAQAGTKAASATGSARRSGTAASAAAMLSQDSASLTRRKRVPSMQAAEHSSTSIDPKRKGSGADAAASPKQASHTLSNSKRKPSEKSAAAPSPLGASSAARPAHPTVPSDCAVQNGDSGGTEPLHEMSAMKRAQVAAARAAAAFALSMAGSPSQEQASVGNENGTQPSPSVGNATASPLPPHPPEASTVPKDSSRTMQTPPRILQRPKEGSDGSAVATPPKRQAVKASRSSTASVAPSPEAQQPLDSKRAKQDASANGSLASASDAGSGRRRRGRGRGSRGKGQAADADKVSGSPSQPSESPAAKSPAEIAAAQAAATMESGPRPRIAPGAMFMRKGVRDALTQAGIDVSKRSGRKPP